ncbi:MAG: cation diffusion facilitator family transporter [Ancrocorticia sp.]|uniref:cation diffusion facilitator family transporter n=1 Tax=Ancrocorticia sp. TaxID=2593684 RepID=UPI003F8EE28D
MKSGKKDQSSHAGRPASLVRFAWLSVAAALFTLSMKTVAYAITGSVGLLSDAAESVVNVVAAVVALLALHQAEKPADSRFTYGRSKAEYFSAAVEGAMIFAAALFIIGSAIDRIIHPQPIENVGIGLLISVGASIINGTVGLILIRAGKKYTSPTLSADGKHLMTDVVTSAGVLVGIGLVGLTQWNVLDPIVALIVGINITVTGMRLISDSLRGLMDVTLPEEQNSAIVHVLQEFSGDDVTFHGLQTRVSGRESFANVDLLVPGTWTVLKSHNLAEKVKAEMKKTVPGLGVLVHVEPIEDPTSYEDIPDGYVPIPLPPSSMSPQSAGEPA